MHTTRLHKTKNVMATGLVALVVAALTFGGLTRFIKPVSPPIALTAGTGFVVSSHIYASPACAGPTVSLVPGATDCAVFSVQNTLSVPISVQSLTMAVSSAPSGCPAVDFSLPTFTGTLMVPGDGTSTTSGLPISLTDTHADQDACSGATIGFSYSGTAQYTDDTTTSLTVSPTTPSAGQALTLTATVTGSNASSDPASPGGSVTFESCTTAACSAPTPLGTATVGSNGTATLTTTAPAAGTDYLEAVYGGSGSDFSTSSSTVSTVGVADPVSNSASSSSAAPSGSSTTRSPSTSPSAIAFTGADIAGMVLAALALIGAGSALVLVVRRRRKGATQ